MLSGLRNSNRLPAFAHHYSAARRYFSKTIRIGETKVASPDAGAHRKGGARTAPSEESFPSIGGPRENVRPQGLEPR